MVSKPRFDFYEVVRVRESPKTISSGIALLEGVVLGLSTDDEPAPGEPAYSVHLDALGESWFLYESELEATGSFRRHEDFHDGSSIRVSRRGEVLS
jgi:Immunity protein 31